MKNLMSQSVKHTIKENFKSYPESYPLSGDGPSDDAIDSLVRWVENEYANENDEDKGTIEEWFEVAIMAYIEYFDFEDDEPGETYTYCKEQIDYIKIKQ